LRTVIAKNAIAGSLCYGPAIVGSVILLIQCYMAIYWQKWRSRLAFFCLQPSL